MVYHTVFYRVSLPRQSPENQYSRLYFGLPEEKFIFSYIFDVSSTISRKNPYLLIRAFKNAFKDSNKVALVLKFHASDNTQSEIRALSIAVGNDDRVILIEKTFTDAENDAFKYCVDCFVSPHRSEGFGFNIAEMLLIGKPVIATGYSGSNDFFNSMVGYPIKYKMIELDHWVGPYAPGTTWANPDCDDLERLMRHVVDHPEEAKAKAKKGQQEIKRKFSAEAIGRLAMKRFTELELDKHVPSWIRSFGKTKDLSLPYLWTPTEDALTKEAVAKLPHQPTFSIIVPVYNIAPEILGECIKSVQMQSYPKWELCVVDDCSTKTETIAYLKSLLGTDQRYRIDFLSQNMGISGCMNKAVAMASGEFIAFLDNDDVIHQDALLRVVQEINHYGNNVDFIYTDEVKLNQEGQVCDSYFKPDFSPEHLESVMYLLHFLVVRKRLFLALDGFREEYSGAQDYDLALRLLRVTNRILHIDEPLYAWRKISGSASDSVNAKPTALIAAKMALEDHGKEKYGDESVVETTSLEGIFHLRKFSKTRPKVTLVICTDNRSKDIEGRGYINMLGNMYNSIIEKTTYPNYEILIAANGMCSVSANIEKERIVTRVLYYKANKFSFNFSHKINWALGYVETEYFVILNDDMEVIEPKWLDYLMDQIQDPDVGAVGAKLLTGLGTIQHVGVIVSTEGATRHVYHGFPGDFVGYNGYTHVIRNFSAVTGACLATKREVFDAVGGFDELFAIDYNDIDFCLKIQDKGYRVVLNPNVVLFHFENATLPRVVQDSAETELFKSRWSSVINRDPCYNKNLSQIKHDFSDREIVSSIYNQRLFIK